MTIISGAERVLSELEVAERVDSDTDLRADLDTWRLAELESDGPTRLIHYFRIYDREARAVMRAEPQLLTDEETKASMEALVAALPERLTAEQRDRLRSAIGDRLSRVRRRSRPAVLAERLTKLLSREITPSDIARIDKARGRYAHNPTERETEPEGDDERLLRDSAAALLREALGALRDGGSK